MSAATSTAGYPVHAVRTYYKRSNPNRVRFTHWTATCGATGVLTGAMATFGQAGKARKAELCRTCFPAGHGTYHPDPSEVSAPEARP